LPQAERSARPPSAAVMQMDRDVLEYLAGRASLESAVESCLSALGPRPTLAVSVASPDEHVQRRLRALETALATVRAKRP
jgi:hypothetical protein